MKVITLTLLFLACSTSFISTVFAQNLDIKSERIWRTKVRKDPKNPVARFNLAVTYHKNKKYRKALVHYAKVIKSGSSLAPVCFYYMARIFKEQKKIAKAKKAVDKIDIKKVPANLRKRVLLFKNGLYIAVIPEEPDTKPEEPVEEKKFSIYWDLAGGTNNNPAYANSFSESDTQLAGKVYLGYLISASNHYEIKANYAFNGTFYGDNSDSDSTYHNVTLPSSYYFGDNRLRLTPEYTIDTYTAETYSYSPGASFDYSRKLGTYYATLYFQYVKTEVADDDNDYLNGNYGKAKASVRKRWQSSDLTLGVTFSDYNYDDTDDVISSYTAPAVDISLGYYLGQWDFSLYSIYEKRAYATDSDSFDREDTRILTAATAGWTYKPWLRLYFSATYSSNSSNDSDNNYHQTSLLAGFSGGY